MDTIISEANDTMINQLELSAYQKPVTIHNRPEICKLLS